MWVPINQRAMRLCINRAGNCQTDMLVLMYFLTRWDYRKPNNVAFCIVADIVKGTGVLHNSAKKSADRLVHIGFLLAKMKSGTTVLTYALNHAVLHKKLVIDTRK